MDKSEWISTRPTSQWQRGCNDARAGRMYNQPSDGMDSYRNGYEFGKGGVSNEQIDDAYREAWGDRKVVLYSPIPVEVLRAFARIICRLVSGAPDDDALPERCSHGVRWENRCSACDDR